MINNQLTMINGDQIPEIVCHLIYESRAASRAFQIDS